MKQMPDNIRYLPPPSPLPPSSEYGLPGFEAGASPDLEQHHSNMHTFLNRHGRHTSIMSLGQIQPVVRRDIPFADGRKGTLQVPDEGYQYHAREPHWSMITSIVYPSRTSFRPLEQVIFVRQAEETDPQHRPQLGARWSSNTPEHFLGQRLGLRGEGPTVAHAGGLGRAVVGNDITALLSPGAGDIPESIENRARQWAAEFTGERASAVARDLDRQARGGAFLLARQLVGRARYITLRACSAKRVKNGMISK